MLARFIIDPPASGAWNMAKDQALAEFAGEHGEAILRFYRWEVPTLSLGYFQEYLERNSHPALATIPYVRRSTGGGAILHDQELTYSLAFAQGTSKGADPDLYRSVHQALIELLTALGWNASFSADACGTCDSSRNKNYLCFDRRSEFDIVVDGYKIVGSAQRRHGNTLLQHGSIILRSSPSAPHLLGLLELNRNDGHPSLTEDELQRDIQLAIRRLLEKQLGWRWDDSTPSLDERIREIEANQFASEGWNDRR